MPGRNLEVVVVVEVVVVEVKEVVVVVEKEVVVEEVKEVVVVVKAMLAWNLEQMPAQKEHSIWSSADHYCIVQPQISS